MAQPIKQLTHQRLVTFSPESKNLLICTSSSNRMFSLAWELSTRHGLCFELWQCYWVSFDSCVYLCVCLCVSMCICVCQCVCVLSRSSATGCHLIAGLQSVLHKEEEGSWSRQTIAVLQNKKSIRERLHFFRGWVPLSFVVCYISGEYAIEKETFSGGGCQLMISPFPVFPGSTLSEEPAPVSRFPPPSPSLPPSLLAQPRQSRAAPPHTRQLQPPLFLLRGSPRPLFQS